MDTLTAAHTHLLGRYSADGVERHVLALEDHASDVLQMVDVLATPVDGDPDRRQIEKPRHLSRRGPGDRRRLHRRGRQARLPADARRVVVPARLTRPRPVPPGRRSGSAASHRRVALPRRAR